MPLCISPVGQSKFLLVPHHRLLQPGHPGGRTQAVLGSCTDISSSAVTIRLGCSALLIHTHKAGIPHHCPAPNPARGGGVRLGEEVLGSVPADEVRGLAFGLGGCGEVLCGVNTKPGWSFQTCSFVERIIICSFCVPLKLLLLCKSGNVFMSALQRFQMASNLVTGSILRDLGNIGLKTKRRCFVH